MGVIVGGDGRRQTRVGEFGGSLGWVRLVPGDLVMPTFAGALVRREWVLGVWLGSLWVFVLHLCVLVHFWD